MALEYKKTANVVSPDGKNMQETDMDKIKQHASHVLLYTTQVTISLNLDVLMFISGDMQAFQKQFFPNQ